ncbi:MAG: MiaB/RimO family radical SAM methylthiotransferase [candidate division WOR-3 bacterium]
MADVKVYTIGCRLNQAEGEILGAILGEQFASSEKIFVINTCAVTKTAVRKSLKIVRRINRVKSPEDKIVITGCLTEASEMERIKNFDLIITQKEKAKLITDFQLTPKNFIGKRARPLVKVADGCVNSCTFCLARVIRGPLVSFSPEKIIKEIEIISKAGCKEVVLTALNLGAYGLDLGISLTKLLRTIPDFDIRLRLSSIEPDMITRELLELFTTKRLCRHLHIPIQSGDDDVLQAMGRKYRTSDIKRIFDMIIKYLPDANIGTDIIVGFPNETEEAFLRTVKLLNELPISYLHIFPYSPRKGTFAYQLYDPISLQVKRERITILKEVSIKKRIEYRKRFLGKKLEAIVESKKLALSDNYLKITLTGNDYRVGDLIEVVLTN